jgi:hypothetical protein
MVQEARPDNASLHPEPESWPGLNREGEVEVRGMSVFHCHLLNHEDRTTMAKFLLNESPLFIFELIVLSAQLHLPYAPTAPQ